MTNLCVGHWPFTNIKEKTEHNKDLPTVQPPQIKWVLCVGWVLQWYSITISNLKYSHKSFFRLVTFDNDKAILD